MFRKEGLWNSELLRVRPHPGQSRLHRLLHDLADLSGHGEPAFALHRVGFNEQDVATRRSPRESHNNTSSLRTFRDFTFAANLDAAQEFLNNLGGHDQLFGLALGQTASLFAAHRTDVPLQIPYPGFASVVPNDVA